MSPSERLGGPPYISDASIEALGQGGGLGTSPSPFWDEFCGWISLASCPRALGLFDYFRLQRKSEAPHYWECIRLVEPSPLSFRENSRHEVAEHIHTLGLHSTERSKTFDLKLVRPRV